MSNVNWPEFWQTQIASPCPATLEGAVIGIAGEPPAVFFASDPFIAHGLLSDKLPMLIEAAKADESAPAPPTAIHIKDRLVVVQPFPTKGIVIGSFESLGSPAVAFVLAKESVLIVIGSFNGDSIATHDLIDMAHKVQREAESRM